MALIEHGVLGALAHWVTKK
ncbi:TPA: hypothetical protein ANIA_11380 [Aspergillus nidulans FGSC A4]|uniref:Uncharacterized protein n=1 Tax=Emericella nidulans (strain FGSC A4 / ATCC 38163 / CBS 112.46 / NRRL 194 / M139) TaxID=227321 RepID=C8VI47_EMENI|nr:TPA: hypothetical protein ANIA_11380 [Aspergillus nidulans FGSC A4]